MSSKNKKQIALYLRDFSFNTSGWLRHALLYHDGIARFCPAPKYRSVYNSFSERGVELDLVRWRCTMPAVKATAEELDELERKGILTTLYFRNEADKKSFDDVHRKILAEFKQIITERGIKGNDFPIYNRLTDQDFIHSTFAQMKAQRPNITEDQVVALMWEPLGMRREQYEEHVGLWNHVMDDSIASEVSDFLRSRDLPSSVQRMSTDSEFPPVVRMPSSLWHIYTAIHHRRLIELQMQGDKTLLEGTDNRKLIDSMYGDERTEELNVKLSLRDVLPVPSERISLLKIAEFRERRHEALLRLRTKIDTLCQNVSKTETPDDYKGIVRDFTQGCTEELEHLRDEFKDGTAEAWRTSISYFVSTLGGAVGAIMSASPLVIALTAAAGAVGVESTWAKIRQRDRIGRKSPYAYLFQAWREGIT